METWLSILFIIICPYIAEVIKETVKQIAKATVTWLTNKSLDKLKALNAKPQEEDTKKSLAQPNMEVAQIAQITHITNVTNIIFVIQDISRQR